MARKDLTGFVLCGGKSTRMGTDKAALALEGRTLLEHAVAILREVAGEVAILGPRQLYGGCGVPVIEDIYPGCGPIGGIHAALTHVAQAPKLSLIIAVDTPFLEPKFLAYLAERARESGAVVTTPEIGGYRQPLCAVYSQEFLPIAEQALRAGAQNQGRALQQGRGEQYKADVKSAQHNQKSSDYKIVPLFPEGRTCVITEAEMHKFAFAPEMFDNLNTQQDMERARQRNMKP